MGFLQGHFFGSIFWGKIFSTNCSAHIAKNPRGLAGEGVQGGVVGRYPRALKEKPPESVVIRSVWHTSCNILIRNTKFNPKNPFAMSKKFAPRFITFKVTLISASGVKVYTIVKAADEDKAMDFALRRYEGMEVYDTEVL